MARAADLPCGLSHPLPTGLLKARVGPRQSRFTPVVPSVTIPGILSGSQKCPHSDSQKCHKGKGHCNQSPHEAFKAATPERHPRFSSTHRHVCRQYRGVPRLKTQMTISDCTGTAVYKTGEALERHSPQQPPSLLEPNTRKLLPGFQPLLAPSAAAPVTQGGGSQRCQPLQPAGQPAGDRLRPIAQGNAERKPAQQKALLTEAFVNLVAAWWNVIQKSTLTPPQWSPQENCGRNHIQQNSFASHASTRTQKSPLNWIFPLFCSCLRICN